MRLHIHYSPVWNTSNWMAFFRPCCTMSSFKGHMSTLLRRQRWFIQTKGCRDHFWCFSKQEFRKWSQLMSKCSFLIEQRWSHLLVHLIFIGNKNLFLLFHLRVISHQLCYMFLSCWCTNTMFAPGRKSHQTLFWCYFLIKLLWAAAVKPAPASLFLRQTRKSEILAGHKMNIRKAAMPTTHTFPLQVLQKPACAAKEHTRFWILAFRFFLITVVVLWESVRDNSCPCLAHLTVIGLKNQQKCSFLKSSLDCFGVLYLNHILLLNWKY